MSTRLQVVLDAAELREIQRSARRARLTVAEWVRQALRAARSAQPSADVAQKLQAIRSATAHQFPAPDVEQMLGEIEAGYANDEGR